VNASPLDLSAAPPPKWHCGTHRFTLARPLIMGVVNVTPDSFSDGGRFFAPNAAREGALRLLEEGADLLDVGGESTRPGAADVSVAEELRRVIPLVETLVATGAAVSVDTSKPEVMKAALAAGACVINDVRALREPGAVEAVAGAGCGVVLMHMQGEPCTMQTAPHYDDVVAEVAAFLRERRAVLRAAGVADERITFDPGFGFGKTPAHNYTLLARLRELAALGPPLLVGMSRKSMLGHATGRAVDERLAASIAAAVLAVERGAAIVRVHDVAATRDALQVRAAMQLQATRDRFSGEAN
jgi:dihydropteroate synthase